MARRPNNELLYKVFKEFLDLCILNNRSLLWPDEKSWTSENVSEVKRRMVESPILGTDLSFEEKLQKQMQDASPELWRIICDIYYVYFLPSTYISLDKKQKDIRWAAEQGALTPPPTNAEIWEAQKQGFTRTTLKYHYKYAQFWFILLFADHLKHSQDSRAVISEPKNMQQTLDTILESIPNKTDRAYDMRHAMLYMAFPDFYERIISTRDKEKILDIYRNRIAGPIPMDLDEAIYKIRMALSTQYDKSDRPFDFYQDLKPEWKPGGKIPAGTVTVSNGIGQVTVPKPDEPVVEPISHTEIQWILLKLGNDMGFDVWVARNDRNREFEGHRFADLPKLKKELPLQFDEATNRTIELIDVLWLKGNTIVAAFEIESTTLIYSGLLRLADLIAMQPNLNIPLYLVAPEERRNRVIAEVNRPVFSRLSPAMSEICRFISFPALRERVSKVTSVVKFLKPDFIGDLSESCEVEEEQE